MSKTNITIIGLTGLPGTGKDTIAEHMVRNLRFDRVSFAQDLYVEVANAFGVSAGSLMQRATKETPQEHLALHNCRNSAFLSAMIHMNYGSPRSPRELLQLWGTEFRRSQDPEYWIRRTREHIEFAAKRNLNTLFVVPDVRFVDEAKMLYDLGDLVEIWHVQRPGCEDRRSAHASDQGLPSAAITLDIVNDSDLEALRGTTSSLTYHVLTRAAEAHRDLALSDVLRAKSKIGMA